MRGGYTAAEEHTVIRLRFQKTTNPGVPLRNLDPSSIINSVPSSTRTFRVMDLARALTLPAMSLSRAFEAPRCICAHSTHSVRAINSRELLNSIKRFGHEPPPVGFPQPDGKDRAAGGLLHLTPNQSKRSRNHPHNGYPSAIHSTWLYELPVVIEGLVLLQRPS